MGYYINIVNNVILPAKEKAKFLIDNANAQIIPMPTHFQENLVCVVENTMFDAAGYAYNEKEMLEFLSPDMRRKIWLIVPNADILSSYK
jgi:hypothetical protein